MAGKIGKTEQAITDSVAQAEKALTALNDVTEGGEVTGGLPEGWVVTRMGDLARVITKGTTPTTAGFKYTESGIPFIKVENIGKNGIELTSVHQYISDEAHASLKRSQFEVDDVLFSIAGTIGKTALVTQADLPANTNQAVAIIRGVSDFFEPKFLRLQLTEASSRIAEEKARGGGMNNVSLGDLKSLDVFLPPLAEQTVIAQTLDTLLAQVYSIKARLDAIPKILKTFRQSVLAAAVSGKLTEEWRGEEGVLSEFVQILNGARNPVSANERKKIQGKIPYYGATGIVDYLDGFTHEGRLLLVGEDGANLLTKSKDLAFMVEGRVWVNNHAHVLKEKASISLDYIRIVINSLDLSPWITGSAQPKLTKRALELLPVPKCSYEEQLLIVSKVKELFAFADKIEQQVKNAQGRVNNLTQSILGKAFRGELTGQWRAENPDLISGDNSAEALLAKIKEEREILKQKAKPKKKATRKKSINK